MSQKVVVYLPQRIPLMSEPNGWPSFADLEDMTGSKGLKSPSKRGFGSVVALSPTDYERARTAVNAWDDVLALEARIGELTRQKPIKETP